MAAYRHKHWSIELPDTWVGERDEECDTLYDPQGYGSVEISTLMRERSADEDFLEHLAADHLAAGAKTYDVQFGPFEGFTLSYGSDEAFCQEWYLRAGRLVLFVSYACAPEHEGLEEEVVEAVLGSLKTTASKPPKARAASAARRKSS
jgi:hypothetical protein